MSQAQAEQSHECSLTCRVVDSKTQQPLPNATILVKSMDKWLVTDSEGYAVLKGMCACQCHLKVQYVGYQSLQQTVNLKNDSSITLYLSESENILEEVSIEGIIQGTKLKTLSVKSVDAQKLMEAQTEGLGQALENITGVQSLRTGNHVAKPIIHGLHSNRIVIMNNGIKQEGQQWGAEHAPEIDAFMAENLSVVKGAAAVQYGAEALGGVVLVEPAELPTKGGMGGSLQLSGASNGRMGSVAGVLEGGIGKVKGLGFRMQGSRKKAGDAKAPNYWLSNTGIDETGISAALGLQRKRWGIEGFYSFYQNQTGILAATSVLGSLTDLELALSQDKPARTAEGFSYAIGWPRQEVDHHLMKVEGFWKLGKNRLEWQYGFQRNHRQEYDRRLGEERSMRPVIDLLIKTHSLDMNYSNWGIGRWNGTAGLNLAYKNNDNIPGTGRIPFIPNHNSWEAGVFLLQEATWDRWSVEAGLRYDVKRFNVIGRDYRNEVFEDNRTLYNFTATAGATFKVNAHHKLSSNIGTAWRAPHVAELYAFGKKQGVGAIEYGLLIGAQNEVQSWEGQNIPNEQGIKWVGNYRYEQQQWVVDATIYANWIQNYIYLMPYGVTSNVSGPYPYYRYRQTNAFFTGLDIDVAKRISPRWNWSGSASLLWAEDTKNKDELPFIPANRFQNSLNYELPKKGRWQARTLGLELQYTAQAMQAAEQVFTVPELVGALGEGIDLVGENPRSFDFMEAPEGYALVNFSASARVQIGEESLLRMNFSIENILNTRYRRYTNRLRYFADEPGRNVRVSLKYVF